MIRIVNNKYISCAVTLGWVSKFLSQRPLQLLWNNMFIVRTWESPKALPGLWNTTANTLYYCNCFHNTKIQDSPRSYRYSNDSSYHLLNASVIQFSQQAYGKDSVISSPSTEGMTAFRVTHLNLFFLFVFFFWAGIQTQHWWTPRSSFLWRWQAACKEWLPLQNSHSAFLKYCCSSNEMPLSVLNLKDLAN